MKHYSIRTETQYAHWVKRLIVFYGNRHPKDMGAAEVEAFLSHLAVDGNVAAFTQNQAFLRLFLYRDVLGVVSPWMSEVIRSKRPRALAWGPDAARMALMLDRLSGVHGLIARMLYGARLRSRSAGDCDEQDRPATSGCRRSAWAYLLSVDQPMAGASGVQYASCPLRGLPCVISSKRFPC